MIGGLLPIDGNVKKIELGRDHYDGLNITQMPIF